MTGAQTQCFDPSKTPSHAEWSRRAFTSGVAIALFLAGCSRQTMSGAAGDQEAIPRDPAFLDLSRALTGHQDLDPDMGGRIAQAFGQLFPAISRQFAALSALARTATGPEALLEAATKAGLGEAALTIVAAWYTGSVGSGASAVGIAYADALMNRPVADGLKPPTYQLGGPGWWIAQPPAAGISLPVERAATRQEMAKKS